MANAWSVEDGFLGKGCNMEAVISDSISQSMYVLNPSRHAVLANLLLESISFQNVTFSLESPFSSFAL